MSATAVGFVACYRAACTVLVDASGNFVNDLLNSWVGRVGEWLVLAGVMAAYAVHTRRQQAAALKSAQDVSRDVESRVVVRRSARVVAVRQASGRCRLSRRPRGPRTAAKWNRKLRFG
jgi:hypothetical protein